MEPPPGWGKSRLTQHLTDAQHNTFATFHLAQTHNYWLFLEDLNDVFETLLQHLHFPLRPMAASLVMRSYSAHLAAIRLIAATQVPETYPQLRSALEWASYALLLSKDDDMAKAWRNRQNDKAARDEIRRNGWRKSKEHLRHENLQLAEEVVNFYKITIDYGAHPNLLGVTGALNVIEHDGGGTAENSFFVGDEPSLYLGLYNTCIIGLITLEVCCLVFPDRARIINLRGSSLEKHTSRLRLKVSRLFEQLKEQIV